MNNLPLAFLMGLLGSLHCAVMCGPLMLSMPLEKKSSWQAAWGMLLYQSGRIFTYSVMGAIAGWLGSTFNLVANQKMLSISIGLLLIVFTLLQMRAAYSQKLSAVQFKLIHPVAKLMGKLMGLPFWQLMAGMLNGIIPCGMVYLALATAVNGASVSSGLQFMFLFGLGTSPLLMMISLGGIYLKKYIRFNTKRLIPWFMLFMGVLLLLRSAELGIPFISPNMSTHFNGTVLCR
ncbi:sulfite exporter TauE/SafE family protein [Pedobacter ghigonis]|uniref:sulfite exporter TauE/SafE family protein n=1 Tax=Pedobacter ghigonis TaxID=2730403 RepID=UPI00158C1749|nr:sulfite exporter TauE/SafE family protein [Pedobacter ghigonis]